MFDTVAAGSAVGEFARIETEEIGSEIVCSIGTAKAILMKCHGVFTISETAGAALKTAVMVEDAARTVFYVLQLGKPLEIPPEEVAKLHRRYMEEYGQE